MIVFVDIEHIRVKQDPPKWRKHLAGVADIKFKLEEISGEPCLIVRYERVSPQLLKDVDARAVLVSGNITEFQHYSEAELAGLRAIFREATRPTVGFCGGAQMMAETFGSRAAAIDEGEQGDMMDGAWKERTHESGYTQVRQTKPHPLFAGLGDEMTFLEAHYWEIKSVPEGFESFAETDTTPIQFLAHKSMPLFASQFHPEAFDDSHPDGRKFLENFFKLMDSPAQSPSS